MKLTSTHVASAHLSRRQLMIGVGAAWIAGGGSPLRPSTALARKPGSKSPSLANLASEKGLLLGAAFADHELDEPYGSQYADAYRKNVSAITSELSFKMSSLRPDAATLNFAPADRLMNFASNNALKVRAHTLIWNDDLPQWIHQLSAAEVEQLMEAHLLTVMERYRGKVWAWDVVNEPIGPWDGLPGNLRKGPFLSAMGEGYIARAFRSARRHDPNALLVLNEAQTESADSNGKVFRDSLLALLKRLKAEAVPIDAVGLQAHLRSDLPYDMERFVGFLDEIAALGFAIHITECDVNDSNFHGTTANRDDAVAKFYRRFLTPVLAHKAVTALSFWQLSDRTSWLYYMEQQKGAARVPRPLLLDSEFCKKPAWYAVEDILKEMQPR